MTTKYAVMMLATKWSEWNQATTCSTLLFVDATSSYEAEGKAWAICRKQYSDQDGWKQQWTGVASIKTPSVDPETYQRLP